MKDEALKLADELEEFYVDPDGFPYMIHESVTMIRRLVEELDKLNFCLIAEQEHIEMLAEEIDRLQAQNDSLNLELCNPIDMEEWAKHQKPV